MNIDTNELQKAVIDGAVAQLVEQFTDPDHEISILIRKGAKTLIETRVNKAIDEEISRIVNQDLEKIIFPCTNEYGEKKGGDLTLREFIAKQTNNVFCEYLNSDGKPTTDSWYRKPENQRINKLISAAIGNELQSAVTAAAKTIQANINRHIADYVKTELDNATKCLVK